MLTASILMLNEILWVHFIIFPLKGFNCKFVDMSTSTLGLQVMETWHCFFYAYWVTHMVGII